MDPNETEVETNDAPLSLRDSLSQAFDSSSDEPAAVADPVEPEGDETAAEAAQRVRDEAGRFAKEKAAPKVTTKPTVKPAVVKPTPMAKPVAGVPGAKPLGVTPPAGVDMKAPQSFRGPAKEAWAQTPETVRVEVLKREKEIATQLAGIGEERKYAGTMKAAFAPFEAQIRAEGSTPEAAIGKLMNTAMALRTAPPAHKAKLVAGMISDFGIPLEHLVAELQGQGSRQPAQEQPQHQQQVDPAAIAEQVRAQLMQQFGTQRDTALVARAETEVSSFLDSQPMHGLDGADYSDEIRADMADIIERASGRGSTITLERAYSLAAREHPEVSKVLSKQERAAGAAKANASTQQARVAASSVRNQPATQPVTRADSSNLRSALEASFDAASER